MHHKGLICPLLTALQAWVLGEAGLRQAVTHPKNQVPAQAKVRACPSKGCSDQQHLLDRHDSLEAEQNKGVDPWKHLCQGLTSPCRPYQSPIREHTRQLVLIKLFVHSDKHLSLKCPPSTWTHPSSRSHTSPPPLPPVRFSPWPSASPTCW